MAYGETWKEKNGAYAKRYFTITDHQGGRISAEVDIKGCALGQPRKCAQVEEDAAGIHFVVSLVFEEKWVYVILL